LPASRELSNQVAVRGAGAERLLMPRLGALQPTRIKKAHFRVRYSRFRMIRIRSGGCGIGRDCGPEPVPERGVDMPGAPGTDTANGVLNVVTYNIHKGYSPGNRRLSLRHMRDALHGVGPDLVLAQEVMGSNAAHAGGDHGNAILSRYPITAWENIDISEHRLEQRGILHAEIAVPGIEASVHVCCTHLNLLHHHRRRQIATLAARIHDAVPDGCPLIIGGDFNDWRTWVTGELYRRIGVRDAHLDTRGSHARTFPSWRPLLALDRIYVRGLEILESRVLDTASWRALSDHLGLQATLRRCGASPGR
jgi:endonuclease/exonuclease/phosphatase family metal-dependent hydrolase